MTDLGLPPSRSVAVAGRVRRWAWEPEYITPSSSNACVVVGSVLVAAETCDMVEIALPLNLVLHFSLELIITPHKTPHAQLPQIPHVRTEILLHPRWRIRLQTELPRRSGCGGGNSPSDIPATSGTAHA
jgi:hypothetical protein